jgi:hypothetical protein
VHVEIVDAAFRTVTQGVAVAAVGGQPDATVYGLDVFWPTTLVEVVHAWMGPRKMARIAVHPVQYRASSGEIRQCAGLRARLVYRPSARPEGERGPL